MLPAQREREDYRDMRKLVTAAQWVVAIFGTLIGAVLLAEKIFYSFDEVSETYNFNLHHVVLGCLIYTALFLLIRVLLGRIRSTKRYVAANIVITLLFELTFCLWLMIGSRIYWGSDPQAVYDLAVRFTQGDYSAVVPRDSYLALYPFQYGIISIYELLMRCTGILNGKLIQLMNIGVMMAGSLAGYGILWKITPRRSSVAVYSILWMTAFPLFFHAMVAYGDLPATGLVLVALYFLLRTLGDGERRGLHMILATAACILACIFKTNARVCMLAILLVSAVYFLKNFDWKKVLWLLLTLVLAFSAVPLIQKSYEIRAGQESGSGIPMIAWIAMSMQEGLGGPGAWNGYHGDLHIRNDYDREATAQQAKKDMQKSMERFMGDPGYMLSFYTTKIAYQWTEGSYGGMVSLDNTFGSESRSPWVKSIMDGPSHGHFIRMANWHQSVLYIAFMTAMILILRDLRREKKFCWAKMYLVVMVIGGFLSELIWESASRHVMMYCVMMFPLAAEGVTRVYDAIRKKGACD